MITKKEIKEKMEKILSTKGFSWMHSRISTICRARINRLSYEFNIDNSIFLQKGDKKIYIERNPNLEVYDGYGKPLYERAYILSNEVMEKLKDDIEKIKTNVCVN